MVRLGRALLAALADYKRAQGLADMADLERVALVLLRDGELSGWVQERLDARVAHLLIDEFQDTSPLQWHALHGWLSGYAGAGRRRSGQRPPGVFIVGDPKQSIYRFRRAEPRVFEAAATFVREGLGGSVLACDHTRRNASPVIEAINGVFGAAGEPVPGLSPAHDRGRRRRLRARCRRCRASTVRPGHRRGAATTRRLWSGATASARRGWSSTRCCANARPRPSPRP
jgi:ATP-dependent exoDNAse (exonuclease V) beta subunit